LIVATSVRPGSLHASAKETRVTRSKLQKEIRQTRPFDAAEVEVYLNLLRTHDRLHGDFKRFLKAEGISQPQYNVLRILRGAGKEGLPCLAVADRMVTRVPDITRLVERLTDAGLVRRDRSKADGRVVITRITPKGTRLLARLDEPVAAFHRTQLGHLTERELASLNRLLEKARG
jgi:DNA-binding MarR family transcriptional regulator